MPLPITLEVTPTPEQLLGFRTQAEQLAAQHFLLTAPIKEVEKFMATTVSTKVRSRDVVYLRPRNPQPPTHGQTTWSVSPSGEMD